MSQAATASGTLFLSSTAFAHQGMIPARHTCDARNVSPPLSWGSRQRQPGAWCSSSIHKLYALDSVLPDLQQPPKARLEEAMQGHVLAACELIGLYRRQR